MLVCRVWAYFDQFSGHFFYDNSKVRVAAIRKYFFPLKIDSNDFDEMWHRQHLNKTISSYLLRIVVPEISVKKRKEKSYGDVFRSFKFKCEIRAKNHK